MVCLGLEIDGKVNLDWRPTAGARIDGIERPLGTSRERFVDLVGEISEVAWRDNLDPWVMTMEVAVFFEHMTVLGGRTVA